MPVLSSNSSTTLEFTQPNQTWLILSGVVLDVTGAGTAVFSSGQKYCTLINHGYIVCEDGSGVVFSTKGDYLYNAAGAEITGDYGAFLNGLGSTLVNYGVMLGVEKAGAAVIGGESRVENHGDISGTTTGLSLGVDAAVNNSGSIRGGSAGIGNSLGVGDSVIRNSGVVSGLDNSISITGTGAALKLVNSGQLLGDVYLGEMQATVINSGDLQGSLRVGGEGDLVVNSGAIYGEVFLGAGFNIYDGARGSMNGFAVEGGGDNDTIKGGADDDTFYGFHGADRLNGRGGDDLIYGAQDVDRMTGGAGADTFEFLLGDSSARAPDLITDFTHAEHDVIDLESIDANATTGGNGTFSFIGTAAFSAAGQLRYVVAGGTATVYGDVDGDGGADFGITLAGVTSLVAADFVL